MICSGSSSSRRAAAATAVALLVACGRAPVRPESRARLVVFPVQNAAGGAAPVKALTEALDAALAARGVPMVSRQELDAALAAHRIRFTGGVDRRLAGVLREQLGADAVLVPTLEQYSAEPPPKIALGVRLVSTEERPVVLWAGGVARTGDDAPGLLGRGLVNAADDLQRAAVGQVAGDVGRHFAAAREEGSCGAAGRFKPRRSFRAPVLDDVGRRSIAVLPFANASQRRGASDVVMTQFVAQLARSRAFEVLDPGVIREELLGYHIVLQGGVSVDQAMAMLDLLQADLVLSGAVKIYEAAAGRGPPSVEFTAYVLDRRTGELVWSSASNGAGDDGVFFFGAGKVHSAAALSCRMVRGVVDGIVGRRTALEPPG
jgi:TolB-like protein